MKAALLCEYDKENDVELKLEDVPEPTIQAPDEVVVRVGAAGLCRIDLHIIEGVWREAMEPDGSLSICRHYYPRACQSPVKPRSQGSARYPSMPTTPPVEATLENR